MACTFSLSLLKLLTTQTQGGQAMYLMNSYDAALTEILEHGVERSNKRTGIKTISVFGMLKRYKLDTPYFPIVTRRKVWPKSVFSELVWFLTGSTNNKDLQKLGCNFWTPWVDHEWEKKLGYDEDAFGPVYGFQLRHFGGFYGTGSDEVVKETYEVQKEFGGLTFETRNKPGRAYGEGGFDQLAWVVNRIKEDHSCRRTLWTLWNPHDVSKMRLPPCHMLYQVLVDDNRNLTGIMYQRSCDFPIGVPANIQFYSALTVMLAQQTDCKAKEFVHVTADSHIYADQIDSIKRYLETPVLPSPKLEIKKAKDIFSYTPDDFVISDAQYGPKIEIPVAV
jgi:thymidylate synthase